MSKIIRTILCPSGLEPEWETVFTYAMHLAQNCDAKVVVLHAVEPLSPTTRSIVDQMGEHGVVERIRSEGIRQMRETLEARVAEVIKARRDVDANADARLAEVIVEEGLAGRSILAQAAAREVDLIVMGARHHSLLGEVGSVSHKVAHHNTFPLLLVPLPR